MNALLEFFLIAASVIVVLSGIFAFVMMLSEILEECRVKKICQECDDIFERKHSDRSTNRTANSPTPND